jgi:aminoglycoside phosphotransferase (APT) family kinase protein
MGQAIGLEAEALVIAAAAKTGAPVPPIAHVCLPDEGLGAAYVMVRLRGETIARKILRDAPFAGARAALTAQCGRALAQIHSTSLAALPALPQADGLAQLNQYEAMYQSFQSPRPVFALAFRYLREHAPKALGATLVHGDFRLGNLMVDQSGLVAALDWELAHVGDPGEDLGWLCAPSWRFGALENPVGGFGALDVLLDAYHAAGGDGSVDHARVRFWMMLGALKWGVMCLIMFRAFDTGLDPSVERAAIGRRASETELDLALMLKGVL